MILQDICLDVYKYICSHIHLQHIKMYINLLKNNYNK